MIGMLSKTHEQWGLLFWHHTNQLILRHIQSGDFAGLNYLNII